MPRNVPGLDRAFTYSEGIAAGLTPDELRHPRWSAPFRATRSFEEPTTVLELAAAYVPHLRPGRFFCHTTAALIHRTWLPLSLQRQMRCTSACCSGSGSLADAVCADTCWSSAPA